jgi:hypothetical protein
MINSLRQSILYHNQLTTADLRQLLQSAPEPVPALPPRVTE